MSDQLSLFASATPRERHERGIRPRTRPYVIQGQERPADLPRLQESAATVEARVLAWFEQRARIFERTGDSMDVAHTPLQCAEALGLKATTVRPRISALSKRTEGPRLSLCAWIPRNPTEDGGSEGWYRFVDGDEQR